MKSFKYVLILMLFCNSIFAVLSEEQIKPNLEIATTKAIEILTNKT